MFPRNKPCVKYIYSYMHFPYHSMIKKNICMYIYRERQMKIPTLKTMIAVICSC